MRTILFTNHYEGKPREILKEIVRNKFELIILEENTRECLLKHIEDADYLLVSGRLEIDKEILDKAVKLRMVQRTGVGLDNISLEELGKRQIPLYVNSGVNADSVAEHTLMLMLACLKNNYEINRNMRQGVWDKQKTGIRNREIRGKTVGLIGFGNIGQKTAILLKAFGADVIYYKRNRLSEDIEEKLGVRYESFDSLLKQSDIISLHCPYNEKTGVIIGQKEMSKMKEGTILINTARGKLVDETAMYEALKSGKISSAGLDVYHQEPIRADCRLLKLKNVNMSPHIGGVTYESFYAMMYRAVENIEIFDKGRVEDLEPKKYTRG
ncbi:MAG: hydroxyacid dehydrogenase [Lachnospiraceae bacterium]|nr:hydroxyacid dehydrogenase [Lachnospiraceae bacterium]